MKEFKEFKEYKERGQPIPKETGKGTKPAWLPTSVAFTEPS